MNGIDWVAKVLYGVRPASRGYAKQVDAVTAINGVAHPVVSTDPPYYDNIGYADLSDFFYIWLRRSLADVYRDLFSTMLTPKANELIASPYRHGGSKKKAKQFFERGLGEAFHRMREAAHPQYPTTVYYAFKQAENSGRDGVASTGWETMLAGMIDAGFSISGTWPMRSELSNRMLASGTNALASSIVLVCRPRSEEAPQTTRGDFLKALKRELPEALRELQHSNIAPVDLAQASIGPGMGIYSRYSAVLEADGSRMSVRMALALINQVLDEYLAEQEGEYDSETRWALAWYEQHAFEEGKYGVAETLSKAKNTAVGTLADSGILNAGGGVVRLLRRDELDTNWDPRTDRRLTVWEATQHLIRALHADGEIGAADILSALRARNVSVAGAARDLAYRLYSICERKKRADEALAYNSLIVAWPQIEKLAQDEDSAVQSDMFG